MKKNFKTCLWTTIDAISGYIYVKTIFHRENLFHFSSFFICFSCTTIDMISVIMLCENDLSIKIVLFNFQVLLFLCCVHRLKRSFEGLYVKRFFVEFFSSSNFCNFFLLLPQWHDFENNFMWKPFFIDYNFLFSRSNILYLSWFTLLTRSSG